VRRARPVSRQRSRQAALQVLYAIDIGRGVGGGASTEETFDAACAHFELPEGARAFAKELVHGVIAHREEIDRIIAMCATNWRVDRMAVVDRNVLRLGVYELRWMGLPASVAIDEAVELARRFGSEPSPSFVNGVLDAVMRTSDSGGEAP
jgi:N utilization substance protein B